MKKQMKQHLLSVVLAAGFLVGIHEGRVAIWKDQDPEPYKVYPYAVSLLPPKARQALKAGIPIESVEEFEALVKKFLAG